MAACTFAAGTMAVRATAAVADTKTTSSTRPVTLAPRAAMAVRRDDGAVLLSSGLTLENCPRSWNVKLQEWAERAPERIFLSEQSGATRRMITYRETLAAVRRIGGGLLAMGLNGETPLAILSENSIDCALVTLAALWVGIAASPISPSYALKATQFSRLAGVMAALQPGALYVADARYAAAVNAVAPANLPIIVGAAEFPGRETISFATLLATPPSAREAAAAAAVTGDTIAKILFTSGSSGDPKPVIQPHSMLAINRQQHSQAFAFVRDEPPVMVDWLPWHHTFGGNNNFGLMLWNGGTLHIDSGLPTLAGIAPTVALLRAHPPTFYTNTPGGFAALLPHLTSEPAFAARFFSRLKLMQYGSAILSTHIWSALDDIAVATTGARILIVSGLGSTEYGPTAMVSTWEQHRQPEAGLPLPGVEVKLVPNAGSWELRCRGACVTPGYWRRQDLTAAAFDEEGFFQTGDAVLPLDPNDFTRGLLFDGRISDNFKLATGTWVHAPKLRAALLNALAPLLKDAVITGHDRHEVGAIGFPDVAIASELASADTGLNAGAAEDQAALLLRPQLQHWITARLTALAANAQGSAERIVRLVLAADEPSFDNGELTDKGVASARAILRGRSPLIARLHAPTPADDIIRI